MATSQEIMDDYLIPGIGLRFELLRPKIDLPVGDNVRPVKFNQNERELNSLNMIPSENSIKNNERKSFNKFKQLTDQCQNGNEPEFIKRNPIQCADWKTHQPDSLAWSVDNVTTKSGKHRTNRVNIMNKERTIIDIDTQNSISSVKNNLIANRSRSLNYFLTPPTHHPYNMKGNISNRYTPSDHRVNGLHQVKTIAYSKLTDKDTSGYADSCTKGHNVNKQMANVSAGISTGSPVHHDRWEGGSNTRSLSKQTTDLKSLRSETVVQKDKMEKKKMMKRQCMYFPLDDYVTLTPKPQTSATYLENTDNNLPRDLTSEYSRDRQLDNSCAKQLSPVTISSGYESDYSPPWPSEMEKVFNQMIGSVYNQDENHTDYFSQSETYPKSADQCNSKPTLLAPGSPDVNQGESFDGCCDVQRSRPPLAEGNRSVLVNEINRPRCDETGVRGQIDSLIDNRSSRCEISFEKYLLNNKQRLSTGCSDKVRSTFSLNTFSERLSDNEGSISSVKSSTPSVNGVRRSKRYRYDVNCDKSCKSKQTTFKFDAEDLTTSLGDFEMQSTCPNSISPIDTFGLFRKSPAFEHSASGSFEQVPKLVLSDNQQCDNFISSDEHVTTNLSHGFHKCVGDLASDNTEQVTRNNYYLGWAKSPRGKCDSDYEHIYDVIPGDENLLSPRKYPKQMDSYLVRKKWTTMQDIRTSRTSFNEYPPALPARSYLKDKGNNSVSSSATRFVCSSEDDLYARVNKRDSHVQHLYTSPLKASPTIFDSSNKENYFESPKSRICDGDYELLSAEAYCHIGPTLEHKVNTWSSGDVLNYIDGIQQPGPKRRDNIYCLLNDKETRAKLSESLEIENKLVNMGLLRNSWSCDKTEEKDEKPPKIPPRVPLNTLRPIYV